jgi:TolB protein
LFIRPFGANSVGEYDLDGSALRRLSGCTGNRCLSALESWSPDGKKLAFLRGTSVAGGNLPLSRLSLFVINADGSGKERLASCGRPPDGCLGDRLSWSPDGSMIAFSRYRLGLYVVSVKTGAVRRLTNCQVHTSGPPAKYCGDVSPAWSPDGSRLVFGRAPGCQAGCGSSAYIVNADGTGLRPLVPAVPGKSGIPAWSPNGRRIALDTDDGVEVMDPNGAHRTVLAPGPASNRPLGDISWSPDGAHVLYFRNSDLFPTQAPAALWVANANGTGHRRLYATTCCDGQLGSPMWSRDGKHVAFAAVAYSADHRTVQAKASGIFVVDVDGRHLHRLLAGVSAYDPWRPIP